MPRRSPRLRNRPLRDDETGPENRPSGLDVSGNKLEQIGLWQRFPKSAPESDATEASEPAAKTAWRWMGTALRSLIILAALGLSAAIAYHWVANPPVAQRRPPQKEPTLVEVMPVRAETAPVIVSNTGTVVPAREIRLSARVSGQIVETSPEFAPGGHFAQGETILRIDDDDYTLAVEQQEANLVRAQSDLKLEFELLGDIASEQEDTDLVLRQPQLETKKAAVAQAQAALNKARLDLERTEIVAPFNAVIEERNADLGAYVTPGTPLATLVGSDEYWVEVTAPVDELRWLGVPGMNSKTGSKARIYHALTWGPGVHREGHVQRIMTGLEPGSRLARLLVVVEDPLRLEEDGDGQHPLMLQAFVRVELIGEEVAGVFEVPAEAVRDGNYL
ncbi:MAG: efflux RND transporter periplasmic adaptor subunit [Candidatus Hydrogenedentes bacterium]|nr:efflux RND transporter periplasmic adaptor subunit [Candidatus Hydrogenedentota bacterium]